MKHLHGAASMLQGRHAATDPPRRRRIRQGTMRRSIPATLVLALLTLVLLTACGSVARPAATRSAPAGARADGTVASGSLGASEAGAFVRAVNLRAADLPGFKATRERQSPETAAEAHAGAALRTCLGEPRETRAPRPRTREGDSPSFTREAGLSVETISSSVEVQRSSSDTELELELMRSGHTRACLSHYLSSLFGQLKTPGAALSAVTVRAFSPGAPGTDGSFGWHVGATISTRGLVLPLRFDVLGFAYRSATVMLLDLGFPHVPEGQERLLFALLVARARSFPHELPVPAPAAAAQPA